MKKIKNKIFAGVATLFIVIIILSVLGIVFINRIAQSSKGTIKDNYRSVEYATEMSKNLNFIYEYAIGKIYNKDKSLPASEVDNNKLKTSIKEFERNLYLESNNITEIGEAETAGAVQQNYKTFLAAINDIQNNKFTSGTDELNIVRSYFEATNENIYDVYKLNINAILKRNIVAENSAEQVTIYMAIVGSLSIILTLFFILKFPGKIVSPITELTNKIIAISERNYNQQLNITSNDEMGELARSFNVMVQRLKEYEETNLDKLLFEKKRMDAVVRNLQDAVMILDENRNIIMANDATLKLTGLKENDIISKYAPDIAAKNDLVRTMITNIMSSPYEDQPSDIQPIKIVCDGKEQFYSLETIAVDIKSSVNKDNLVGYILMLKNITRFQERDAAKTNLIATVSHELKTPLSSINLSLKLLEDNRIGAVNEEQKGIIKSIRQQSVRLSKFVNELLDFSQAETGNIKLKITSVKPEDIVELGVVALTMIMAEKNIQAETIMQPNLPSIRADLEKSVWVLVNILNNAIRYSSVNSRIIISVIQANGFVEFSIKDSGPGISEENSKKIFDKFVQVGDKKSAGTGLGLAIAKEFVQSQKGDIHVESKVGEGSTFSFTLPVADI
ncbi:MAG: ATP-binding protein [Ignavibacteriaceae bacterium]|nr:ATP-binding protein [Ignavibacteriaceae bacterium]